MRRWLTRSFYASLFGLAACGGGGGGCSSCSGVTPLPQGFPVEKRVENAANIRISKSGFEFLNKNLNTIIGGVVDGQGLGNGGKIEFPITTDPAGTDLGGFGKICEGGADAKASPKKCIVEIDVKKSNLKITPTEPNELRITGTIPVLAEYIPGKAIGIPIKASIGDGDCKSVTAANVDLEVAISFETDVDPTHGGRTGLTRIRTTVDPKLTKDEVNLCTDCDIPGLCSLGSSILQGLKDGLFGLVAGQLKAPITDAVDKALCVKPDNAVSPPCPVGSTPGEGDVCRFTDGTCASFALGTDGTLDLSSALASFSPSTKGGLDFQLAVGGKSPNPDNDQKPRGDLNVIKEGATLSMVGGVLPNPVATCVTQIERTQPAGIPTPVELLDNKVANWPAGLSGPDFGLGLSQRFLDHAMVGVYNSGLLCIQTGTESVAQLTSNTLGAIVPSIKTLGLQKANSPLGLILRPGQAPTVKIGSGKPVAADEKDINNTDANITITLNELNADFYVWSSDRFIRAFTASLDLAVPLNLDVGSNGALTPVLSKIFVTKAKVSNNDLVKEDPAKIESAVSQLVGGLAGQFVGGALPSFDLSSATASLGIGITVPPNVPGGGSPGIVKLTKDSDDFLGIFASLKVVTPVRRIVSSPTFLSKDISAEGVHFTTMTPTNAPVLHYAVDVTGERESDGVAEHTYRVDTGLWKPWTTGEKVHVTDDILRLQGTHTVSIKSRMQGRPDSESDVMTVPVVIDADPPQVEIVKKDDGNLTLDAWDHLSHESVQVRVRLDDGVFSAWRNLADSKSIDTGNASNATIEVKDEEGNVARISQELRGKVDQSTLPGGGSDGGCGCTVPGESNTPAPAGGLLALGAIAMAFVRARQRSRRRALEAVAGATVMGVFGSFSGCSCADDAVTAETPPQGGAGGKAGAAGSGQAGKGGEAGSAAGKGGSAGKPAKTCDIDEDCVRLEPGLIGSYTSTAVDGDDVWVAGYSEADYEGEVSTYGDLVVGKWDAAANKVDWKVIDGLDAKEEVDPTSYDITGWREGKSEAGDDVGQWTSTQIVGGAPAVAYFDTTNNALKYARLDGTEWKSHTVQVKPASDIGRYAKLVVVGGKPAIAYLAIEPGADGKVSSFVRLARGKSATPSAAGDWDFENVNENKETPCRAGFCASGTKCQEGTNLCVKTSTACSPSCKSGEICFADGSAAKCGAEIPATKIDAYPEATGLYISAALDGGDVGIVYYDRTRGNLQRAKKVADKWDVAVVAGAAPLETDAGIGASLAIDGKDWHISYVDGLSESLVYVKLTGGDTAGDVETIDDGKTAEGPHLVGDDSSISVSAGKVVVSYQDATGGTLHVATRAAAGGWTTKTVKQDGKFAGFFSSQVNVGGKSYVANWWRASKPKISGDVSLLPLPLRRFAVAGQTNDAPARAIRGEHRSFQGAEADWLRVEGARENGSGGPRRRCLPRATSLGGLRARRPTDGSVRAGGRARSSGFGGGGAVHVATLVGDDGEELFFRERARLEQAAHVPVDVAMSAGEPGIRGALLAGLEHVAQHRLELRQHLRLGLHDRLCLRSVHGVAPRVRWLACAAFRWVSESAGEGQIRRRDELGRGGSRDEPSLLRPRGAPRPSLELSGAPLSGR